MKKIIFMIVAVSAIIISCKTNQNVAKTESTLEGSWELKYISGPRIAFEGLYPNNVPNITFDSKENRFSGYNSCNRFTGSFTLEKSNISFQDDKTAMTMMACQGNGDQVFMSTLPKINSYSMTKEGKTLEFFMGEVAMMRFEKMEKK